MTFRLGSGLISIAIFAFGSLAMPAARGCVPKSLQTTCVGMLGMAIRGKLHIAAVPELAGMLQHIQ